jgi:tRNA 2-thiocytidine biosynthesis protein TtcA
MDYGMIAEGDRLAVAVSGGKDSLSLMHVLRDRQRISPVRFEFAAVHIDFEFEDFNPQPLIRYFQEQGFSYHVEKVDQLKGERWEDIDCFWWSRNRRKALFQMAGREGFTKIAFGHHLDDIVETIILNQFYRGEIGAMKPKVELFGGKVAIIRPLAYVREREMVRLAQELGIDTMGQSKCANDDTSHRMHIKKMLREFESVNPMVVTNIFRSLKKIKSDYLIEPAKAA